MRKMAKHVMGFKNFRRKAGTPPGHLIEPSSGQQNILIKQIAYSGKSAPRQMIIEKPSEIEVEPPEHHWINLVGLSNSNVMAELGKRFDIHPLILEDAMNMDHLPKYELSLLHVFFTLKFPVKLNDGEVEFKHVSLILGNNYLISLQDSDYDLLQVFYERIEQKVGRIYELKPAYLFYALLDYMVDQYFAFLENLRDMIDETEEILIEEPENNHIEKIHHIKKELVTFRKYINALHSAVIKLLGDESKFIDDTIKFYLRDVYDHVVYMTETVHILKEFQTTLLELNMTNVNNSMNRVMKTLTIVAAIFIPLTFMAGIYGMNFTHMPELNWRYSYPVLIGLMLIVALVMVFYMRKKKWL